MLGPNQHPSDSSSQKVFSQNPSKKIKNELQKIMNKNSATALMIIKQGLDFPTKNQNELMEFQLEKVFYLAHSYIKNFQGISTELQQIRTFHKKIIQNSGNSNSFQYFKEIYSLDEIQMSQAYEEVTKNLCTLFIEFLRQTNQNLLKEKLLHEIQQFKQEPKLLFDKKHTYKTLVDTFFFLKGDDQLLQPEKSKPRKKLVKWTKQENIRYIVFLETHRKRIQIEKNEFLMKYATFITNGHSKRLKSRHNDSLHTYKTIPRIISELKKHWKYSEFQYEEQKFHLEQYENQMKVPETKNFPSYLNQYLADQPMQNKSPHFKTDFKEFHPFIKLKLLSTKVLLGPTAFQISQNLPQVEEKISCVTVTDLQLEIDSKNFLNTFEKNSISIVEEKCKAQIEQNDMLDSFFQETMKQKIAEMKILNHLENIKIKRKKVVEEKEIEKWSRIENFRFLAFMVIFRKYFEETNDIPKQVFYAWSEFVGTKSRDKVYNHYKWECKGYETVDEMIKDLMKRYHVNEESLKEQRQLYYQKCRKQMSTIYFDGQKTVVRTKNSNPTLEDYRKAALQHVTDLVYTLKFQEQN